MEKYYIDTCIWLNLFKREGDEKKGKPYCEIASGFFESVQKTGNILLVSTIVLKEMSFKLGVDYISFKNYIREKQVVFIKTNNEDCLCQTIRERIKLRIRIL